MSCTEIYDNIKDFSAEEIVYPAHFDTAYGKIGFERVEIDLSKSGRIPASQMKLGKAKKTIIMYNDTIVTIDSVCSWVNIKNLKQPNLCRFKIYTADEFNNLSTPVDIALTPYTVADRDALSLPAPNLLLSTTSALVEWKTNLSSELFDVYSWSYVYTDKNNNRQTGGEDGDIPSFFVENVQPDVPVTVQITARIVPKINRTIPLLDTIYWTYPMEITIDGTKPVIFLDAPFVNAVCKYLPATFTWKKVDEVNDYTLKISTSYNFPDDPARTLSIPVGNTDSYILTQSVYSNLTTSAIRQVFYWTVVPTGSVDVTTQNRVINIGRELISYPKTNWVADADSYLSNWGDGKGTAAAGGFPAQTIDDNLTSAWHSTTSAPTNQLPHWVRVDLGTEQTIDRVEIYLHSRYRYAKTVRIYTSNSSVANVASWELAKEYVFPYPQDVSTTIELTEHNRGRYLIIYFVDSTSGVYSNLAEIYAYYLED
jgi:hypothetical protein